jgi:Tol biopolymer transport system component
MVFDNRQNFFHLWRVTLDWTAGKALGDAELVSHSGGSQWCPSASRDGTLLTYSQEEPGRSGIRVRSLTTGRETALVSVRARPKVSPDGSQVAYTVAEPNRFYLIPASGGEAEFLMSGTSGSFSSMYSWTPNGSRIVYYTGQPPTWFLLDPRTQRSTPLFPHLRGTGVGNVMPSPDQRWLSFRTPAGRNSPLWIAPLRDGAVSEQREWTRVAEGTNTLVGVSLWSPDGSLLYMLSQADGKLCLWAQRLDPATKRPEGERFPVHHIHNARIDILDTASFGPAVLPDGMIYGAREQTGNVWMAELK